MASEVSLNHWLDNQVAQSIRELGRQKLEEFSTELAGVDGLRAYLAARKELQIISYYLSPRFPAIGHEVVKAALISGLASPELAETVTETKPVALKDDCVDQLIEEEIPVLPVAVNLSQKNWKIHQLVVVRNRMHLDGRVISDLKFGGVNS